MLRNLMFSTMPSSLAVSPVQGEFHQKILASTPMVNAYFGNTVSVSRDGKAMLITANGHNSNRGAAYVFRLVGNDWVQEAILTAYDAVSNDAFGTSGVISPDGSTVVIGSPDDDDRGSSSGSVYIFKKNALILENGGWQHKSKLTTSDGIASDVFGFSVACSENGDVVVAGAHGDDDLGSSCGAAYVFKKNANDTWIQSQKLLGSNINASDHFGRAVGISADASTIAIGARGKAPGAFYVFRLIGSSYVEVYTEAGVVSVDTLGDAIALSDNGNVIVCGNSFATSPGGVAGSGHIRLLKYFPNSSLWSGELILQPDGAEANNNFGFSVAVSGDGQVIVVGCHNDDDQGSSAGTAYIYKWVPNTKGGTTLTPTKIVDANSISNSRFGYSVAVSGDGSIVLIGQRTWTVPGFAATGAACIYK